MTKRCKVVLYGDSLVLEGIGLSLEPYPRLEIIRLNPSSPGAPCELTSLRPSVVILDMSITATGSTLSLLSDLPDLLLIGLDPDGEKVMVFSGQQARSLSTPDLVQIIETSLPLEKSVNGAETTCLW